MIGPIGSAGVQFMLSLVLLRKLDAAAFGTFSFLLVATQLTWGVWGALFCAPLPVTLATPASSLRDQTVRTLFATNLACSLLAFAVFFGIGVWMGLSWLPGALFAGFTATSLLRWFARTYAYATGTPARAAISDLIYSFILAIGVALISRRGDPTTAMTWGAMLFGTCVGFAAFSKDYLIRQFSRADLGSVTQYGGVWREHSRWSLLGVFSTEATANSHAYIITLLRGPTSFAPLAASALLIRPITVAMNALTEFERARMARQIGEHDYDAVVASARFFRLALIATWVATAIATILLLAYKPHLVFPDRYSLSFLAAGAALWMAVSAVRLLRMPESCLLQAGGAFRPLASASVWSSIVSIAAVVLLLFIAGPLWSIAGIFLGEAVFAGWIWRQTFRWLKSARIRGENIREMQLRNTSVAALHGAVDAN